MAAREDNTFDLGEDWIITITCHSDEAGTVVMDLTNGNVAFAMGKPGSAAVLSLDKSSGVTITDAVNGVAKITVTPTMQSALTDTFYTYTIRATEADGSVSDQAYGLITVRGTEFPHP